MPSRRSTMQYMAATAVMTVRIEPGLLDALKARSRREGRTVSAEVVRLIKKELQPPPKPRARPARTMGMFADFDAPDLEEFVLWRRELSAQLLPKLRKRSTRRS